MSVSDAVHTANVDLKLMVGGFDLPRPAASRWFPGITNTKITPEGFGARVNLSR